MSIIRELKRRQVFGTVALYAVAAWAVIEVGDMAIESGTITGLNTRNLFQLAVIGLPLVLIAGWFYDITRKGIFRTPPATADASYDTSLHARDYLLLAVLLAIWSGAYWYVHTPPPVAKSIAIMPFENRGNDPENAHFAYGIQDDLMTQLQRIGDLKLIARSSVRQVDPGMSVQTVGLRLGAAYIMRGSVERVLDRIRVSVVLVEAAEAKQAWSGSFDRELSAANLFDIRDEITTAITDNLQALLSPEEKSRVYDQPTGNLEAYTAYLRGLKLMERRQSKDLEKALEQFRKATELDPEFALAFSGIGQAAHFLAGYGSTPPREALAIAKPAIDRALELNDQLGEAFALRGRIYEVQGQAEEAERAYHRALELSPNFVDLYHWYARSISLSPPRLEEALGLTLKAEELDPLSSIVKSQVIYQLIHLGRFDEAEARARLLLDFDPDFAPAYVTMAFVQYVQGRLDQRAIWLRKAIDMDPDRVDLYLQLARTLRLLDDEPGLLELRSSFAASFPGHPVVTALDAMLALYRKDIASATEYTRTLASQMGQDPESQAYFPERHFLTEDYEMARAALEANQPGYFNRDQWPSLMTGDNNQGCVVAYALMKTGEEQMGQDLLDSTIDYLENELPRYIQHADRFPIGTCYLFRGEVDKALEAFERFVSHGHVAYMYSWLLDQWWLWDQIPWFRALQGNPRFDALYRKIRDNMHIQRKNLERLTTEDLGSE